MAEVTLNIEPVSEPVEEVQENEHEEQDEEREAWRSALSEITAQLTRVNETILQQGQSSQETRTLLETQAQLIRDLMTANSDSQRQMLETVRSLLTPPEPAPVIVETEIAPATVEPANVAPVPEPRPKRFRGL